MADIRSQRFNADAQESGDFVEFLGLAGLGQAEAASIKRSDVDLDAERIIVYRHKTDQGFVISIYPQLRPLLEKLCAGKAHDERLFEIKEARKALSQRLQATGVPEFHASIVATNVHHSRNRARSGCENHCRMAGTSRRRDVDLADVFARSRGSLYPHGATDDGRATGQRGCDGGWCGVNAKKRAKTKQLL